jgi:hypothetical protein
MGFNIGCTYQKKHNILPIECFLATITKPSVPAKHISLCRCLLYMKEIFLFYSVVNKFNH